jgi:hypothetical protein
VLSNMLRRFFLSLIMGTIMAWASLCSATTSETAPRIIAEIPPKALMDSKKTVQIRAFDVAPDGSGVAVLYASWGDPHLAGGSELWVALWSFSSNKLAWKQKIATDTTSGLARIQDVKSLIFTADQSHLLALALGQIWSIDLGNGERSESISSSRPNLGNPKAMHALNGTTVAVTYAETGGNTFYIDVMNIASGKDIAGCSVSAVPQSFSPDGKLAITTAPGQYNSGGVAELQVINVATGATLKVLSTNFAFKNRHPDEYGSVVARFLDDREILVVPDNMIDHTGNHSGYSLEVIDILKGQVVHEITPSKFAPTGVLALSRDGNRFAVDSVYANPKEFHLESLHPKDLHVNVFIFSKGVGSPQSAVSNVYIGLAGGRGEPLRLSSDGSVLAISESPSGVIKVFQD